MLQASTWLLPTHDPWAKPPKTIRELKAPASSYDLFSPVYYNKKSVLNFTDHTAFFSVFSTVGRDIIVESHAGANHFGTSGLDFRLIPSP